METEHPLDACIGAADRALRALFAPAQAARPVPRPPTPAAAGEVVAELSPDERRRAAALMRVNHAGEIAAQALYHGQALAARAGDRASLGFVVETERQVEGHLDGHLGRLPAADLRSRAIVQQMRTDEAAHGANARAAGAMELPGPVRALMRHTARVMTGTAYWV